MCVERKYLLVYRSKPGENPAATDVTTPLDGWPYIPEGRVILLSPDRPFQVVEYGPCGPDLPPEPHVHNKKPPEWVEETIMWKVDHLHDVQDSQTLAYKHTVVFLCPANS